MKYEITKEQLENIILTDDIRIVAQVKEWFPEAFKTVLKVGKWYKTIDLQSGCLGFSGLGMYATEEIKSGFTLDVAPHAKALRSVNGRVWGCLAKDFVEATESEVFEALKKEAIKRGYKKGNHRCLNSCITEQRVEDNYIFDNGNLWYGTNSSANCVFQKGKWAEIIPTITKQEAEKQLGKKIID